MAVKVRRWLETLDLNPQLREDLTKFDNGPESCGGPGGGGGEVDKAVAKTKAAENDATPGIYVYTLPHYSHPPVGLAEVPPALRPSSS